MFTSFSVYYYVQDLEIVYLLYDFQIDGKNRDRFPDRRKTYFIIYLLENFFDQSTFNTFFIIIIIRSMKFTCVFVQSFYVILFRHIEPFIYSHLFVHSTPFLLDYFILYFFFCF